jgi:7SK snRNA methylphosphate capping enzyme
LGPAKILGIEIDKVLVQRAKSKLQTQYSRFHPSSFRIISYASSSSSGEASDDKQTGYYFPASFADSLGNIPLVMHPYYTSSAATTLAGCNNVNNNRFPFNVQFKCLDVTKCSLEDLKPSLFDVVCCFSVTKWIHLNGGDEALLGLFAKFRDCLKDNGLLILEPQPWSSYYSKSRLDPSLAINYQKHCSIKPDDFCTILQDPKFGFSLTLCIEPETSCSDGFKRPLLIFRKNE